jgi:fused signal recognition particle receptor
MDSTQLLYLGLCLLALIVIVWLVVRSRSSGPTVETPARPTPLPGLGASLRRVWSGGLDDGTWEDLEEVLLASDVGVAATDSVVSAVRKRAPGSVEEARTALHQEVRSQFGETDRQLKLTGSPSVVLIVGVNGSGKTTTIAKLGKQLSDDGKSVVFGAADTFRAAAAEQLTTWGDRLGFRVVRGSEGADPASVAHDSVSAARASNAGVVLIDTAGRLHGKKNLMAELGKIYRVVGGNDGAVDEVLLVLDATSGQNGLAQVKEFAATVPLTGIVLTKLDGTARGGIVVAVEKELGVPVKFIGVGEGLDDLQPFDPDAFVSDLLESA